jgi:hypothetical protein
MKSRIVKSETLIDKSVVIIVKGTAGTEWESGSQTIHRIHQIDNTPRKEWYSCYVLPSHQHSEPEILVSYSTLEECETAFIETLEDDLCDIN